MDKVQLIASLNAQYDANRRLVAQALRRRAADFIDLSRRHAPLPR